MARKKKTPASKPRLQTLIKHSFEKLAGSKSPIQNDYVYVPKGDVYMTRNCRDLTGARGKILYIVYDEKSHERLGLRCPIEVFKLVTENAVATAIQRRDAVLTKDRKHIETARESLVRLFPRIPLDVAEQVLQHGFEKGSGRVGRAGDLESDERVTLAVVAHARHTKTPYDTLLREMEKTRGYGTGARERAREAIKKELEQVLKSWRALPANQTLQRQLKSTQKAVQHHGEQNEAAQMPNKSRTGVGRGHVAKSTNKHTTNYPQNQDRSLNLGPVLSHVAEVAKRDKQIAEEIKRKFQLFDQKEFKNSFTRHQKAEPHQHRLSMLS